MRAGKIYQWWNKRVVAPTTPSTALIWGSNGIPVTGNENTPGLWVKQKSTSETPGTKLYVFNNFI